MRATFAGQRWWNTFFNKSRVYLTRPSSFHYNQWKTMSSLTIFPSLIACHDLIHLESSMEQAPSTESSTRLSWKDQVTGKYEDRLRRHSSPEGHGQPHRPSSARALGDNGLGLGDDGLLRGGTSARVLNRAVGLGSPAFV